MGVPRALSYLDMSFGIPPDFTSQMQKIRDHSQGKLMSDLKTTVDANEARNVQTIETVSPLFLLPLGFPSDVIISRSLN